MYAAEVDHVLVIKSERKLFLMSGDSIVRQYDIALGANPTGHKSQEGDEKTPEGLYELDYKKSDSSFYKAIHISYPNADDLAAAKEAGVDPGGLIMIHGQRNGFGWLAPVSQNFDWTNGCIAVTNSEMDEVWNLVSVGTTIEIRP
ncbi:MAG: L,D-transpeptidase family protein [Pseudomonadota bacterium]